MATIRTAVIGVGYLGKFHAAKYAQLPQSELVAVVDIDPVVCETIANLYRVQSFTHYQELIGKVDAVSIAVPTPLHFPIAEFFLRHGIHVLVEKPFTTTIAEAEELIHLAKTHHCILQVGHLERFNPALKELTHWLQEPTLLESRRLTPFQLRGTDVNVVLDLMIHDIDIVLSLISSPIHHIEAAGAILFSNDIDVANARIEFTNGCVANLMAGRISAIAERTLQVFQKNSFFKLNFPQATLSIHKKGKTLLESGLPEIFHEELTFEHKDALLAEIHSFLSTIEQRSLPLVSGEAGKRALEIALHISALIKKPLLSLV